MFEYAAQFPNNMNTPPVGGPPVGGPPAGGPPVSVPPTNPPFNNRPVEIVSAPPLPKFQLCKISGQPYWIVEGISGKAWNGWMWINI